LTFKENEGLHLKDSAYCLNEKVYVVSNVLKMLKIQWKLVLCWNLQMHTWYYQPEIIFVFSLKFEDYDKKNKESKLLKRFVVQYYLSK